MKGGTNGGKGGTLDRGQGLQRSVLNGAASEYLMCARRDLILDTESYYGGLKLAEQTQRGIRLYHRSVDESPDQERPRQNLTSITRPSKVGSMLSASPSMSRNIV